MTKARTLLFARLLNVPTQLNALALQQKDGAYLSPHGRLVGWDQAAAFTSARIAALCTDLWMPRLQQRWGPGFELKLEEARGVLRHDAEEAEATLLARAQTGRFASNQSISLDAMEKARRELAKLRQPAG